MASVEELVNTARALGAELRSDMTFKSGSGSSYYWANDISQRSKIKARGIAGLEFLRLYAGSDSEWFKRAERSLNREEGRSTIETAVHEVGQVLDLWAELAESGTVEIAGSIAENARSVAATDVMGQVRTLLSDKGVHPAAPIVLAGAALETALRGLAEDLGVASSSPTINGYATALRKADVLSRQQVKDVEQMAGLRNEAAHGRFDDITRQHALLIEQQVNLFLSTLSATGDQGALP